MSPITNNQAAWLPHEKAPAMEVGPGPTPNPSDTEVVIKVAYAAVNAIDWKYQDHPFTPLPYPMIFGTCVSGTIAQLGSAVTRFKLGQRVLGHCDGYLSLKKTNAGFQKYSTCSQILVAELPDEMPLSAAAVLPLAIDTAATGLFKTLTLPLPSLGETKSVGKTVLIWGGSSSVGSTAIQLAVAAGLTVATTSGAHNFDFVKDMGAKYVFDYNDKDVIEQIMKVLKPGDVVYDVVSNATSMPACAEIISRLGGGVLPITGLPVPIKHDNVQIAFVNGLDPGLVDLDLGDAIWNKFVPQALATGQLRAKPDALIVEGGLEKVQEGIDMLRNGVSAKKVVIEIAKEA